MAHTTIHPQQKKRRKVIRGEKKKKIGGFLTNLFSTTCIYDCFIFLRCMLFILMLYIYHLPSN